MSLNHKITPALKIELVQNHPERRSDRVPDNFAQGRLQAEVHQVGSPHSKGTQTRPHTAGACGLNPTASKRGAQRNFLPHHPLNTESSVVGPACIS